MHSQLTKESLFSQKTESKKENKVEETEFDSVSKFRYFDNIKNNNTNVSSFLTIQEGCDKFCHFCVVPYTRGPEVSRSNKEIISPGCSFIS